MYLESDTSVNPRKYVHIIYTIFMLLGTSYDVMSVHNIGFKASLQKLICISILFTEEVQLNSNINKYSVDHGQNIVQRVAMRIITMTKFILRHFNALRYCCRIFCIGYKEHN